MAEINTPLAFLKMLMAETIVAIKKQKATLLSIRLNSISENTEYAKILFNAKKFYENKLPLVIQQKEDESKLIYYINLKQPNLNLLTFEIVPSFSKLMLKFVRYDIKHKDYPNVVAFGYSLMWGSQFLKLTNSPMYQFINLAFESDPVTLSKFIFEIDLICPNITNAELELLYVDKTDAVQKDNIKDYAT